MNELWERVSCLVFEENFALFNSIHFILSLLCFSFRITYKSHHRRTLIDSLLADFLLNNLTLKCCTKSSVSCDAANDVLVYSKVHQLLRERVKPLRMKGINLVLDYLEKQS